MHTVIYEPIGVVRSPHAQPKGTPIQPTAALGIEGTIELFPEYVDGLADLEGFSHLILLYHLHLAGSSRLMVTPFLDGQPHGVFATRAPARPNPIGLSVVCLRRIEGNLLYLSDVDIVDGTPLLDIKPYVPRFDAPERVRCGWLEQGVSRLGDAKDDGRFLDAADALS